MPDWWSAFVTVSASSPPIPFGFCRFFQPKSDSTRPEKGSNRSQWNILVRSSLRRPVCPVLLGCWQTRTCPLLPSAHKPPGSPSVCPSKLPGRGWGIWLVLCHKRTNLWESVRSFPTVLQRHQHSWSLTVCEQGDCAGPEWRAHARLSWSRRMQWAMRWEDFPSLPQLIHQAAADWKTKVCSNKGTDKTSHKM